MKADTIWTEWHVIGRLGKVATLLLFFHPLHLLFMLNPVSIAPGPVPNV